MSANDMPSLHGDAESNLHSLLGKAAIGSTILFALGYLAVTGRPWGLASVLEAAPGAIVPDVVFHYDAEGYYRVLENLGALGRERYLAMNLVDMAFPLAYGLFFVSWIALGCRILFPRRIADADHQATSTAGKWLSLIGAIPSFLDYIENVISRSLVLRFPDRATRLASALGYLSSAKFLAFYVALAILAILMGGVLARRARRGFLVH
jgi:hypothetical protein